jgi:chromosome segregation ATPase
MSNRNKHIAKVTALALSAVLSGASINAMPVFAEEPDSPSQEKESKINTATDIQSAEANWKAKQDVVDEKQKVYDNALAEKNKADSALANAEADLKAKSDAVVKTNADIEKNKADISDTKKAQASNEDEIANAEKAAALAATALSDIKKANPEGAEEILNKRKAESQSADEALKKAETDLAKTQAEEEKARDVLVSYQTALEKATNDKESAVKAQSKAEEELATAKANQATADKALADAIDLRDNKTTQEQTESYQEWQKAKAETEKAQSAYDEAEKAVEKAKADYNATAKAMESVKANPTTVTNTDTALTEAETKAKAALEALNTAKAHESEKQTAYETANQAVTDAKSAVTKAQAEKDTADKAVTDTETALENAKKDVKAKTDAVTLAQEQVTDAEKALSNAGSKTETAQTEYENANKAVTDATNAVATAQKALEDANAKVKAAEAVIAQGSLGFFSSRMNDASLSEPEKDDAKLAYDIITYSTTKESTKSATEKGITYLGRDDDATSLENMKKAIALIGKGNQIIVKDNNFPNLAPFNVADSTMAYAQASANMEAYTKYHWMPSSGEYGYSRVSGENAAWGYSNDVMDNESDSDLFTKHDPYYGWYYQEKEFYEFIQNYKKSHPDATKDEINNAAKEAVKNGQFKYAHIATEAFNINDYNNTGHYLNLTKYNDYRDKKSTGLAVNERNEWTTQVQDFGHVIPGVSYDTYKASFDAYYNKVHANLDSAKKEAESANTALSKAKAELDNAKATLSEKLNALDQAKAGNNIDSLTTAVNTAKANLAKAEKAKIEAEKNKTTLATALSDKQMIATEKATALTSAQSVLAEKETALTNAKTALNTAKADTKAKQTAYDTAVQNVRAKADSITANAKALYDSKVADQSKANTILTNAKQAESNAKATFDDVVSGKAIPSLQAKATKAREMVNEKTKAKNDADTAVAKAGADVQTAANAVTKAQADVEEEAKAVSSATKTKADAESVARAKANAYQESVKARKNILDKEDALSNAKDRESKARAEKQRLFDYLIHLNTESGKLNDTLVLEKKNVVTAEETVSEKQKDVSNKNAVLTDAKTVYDKAYADMIPDMAIAENLLHITDGDKAVFDNALPSDLTFKANGSLEYFDTLLIDGNVVSRSDFDLKSGSTIATLHKDYLKTLAAGTHTIAFRFAYGISENGAFSVKAAPVKAVPETQSVESTHDISKAGEHIKGTSPKTGYARGSYAGLIAVLLSGIAVFGAERMSSFLKTKD